MAGDASIIPIGRIGRRILLIRGHKVMLDSDLARLYGVTTFNLNKAVKRNLDRFPADFSFVLTKRDLEDLIFQTGISSSHGGRRKPARVFTEHGVAMLSSVLRSVRAIQVNIAVMRAFARLRHVLSTHHEPAKKLAELERRIGGHDAAIREIMQAIHELMEPPPDRRRDRIGFHPNPKTTTNPPRKR